MHCNVFIYFFRTISNSYTLENETIAKSNSVTNQYKFETFIEKQSLQDSSSGFDDITNTLSSNYNKLKYII